jgi:hypothetical protein
MLALPWASIVWLLAMAIGIVILALGIWRGGRLARWLEVLALRWVVILWLLISSAFAFISATVIRPYPSWAVIYLGRSRAEGFLEIAPFLARDLAWGVSLLILVFGIWRWNRWAEWATLAFLLWSFMIDLRRLWKWPFGLPEIFQSYSAVFPMIWISLAPALFNALMIAWLIHPRVRARFAEGRALKAAV